MTAAGLRAILVDYFEPPAIANLVKCYQAMPVWADSRTWEFDVVNGWAAIAYVHIAEQHERRIALGGEDGGMKMVNYDVGLVLLYKYLVPDPTPVDSDSSEWVTWADQLCDQVCDHLRAGHRTLGTDGTGSVWQVAEGQGTNQEDLTISRDIPVITTGIVQVWQAISFSVQEIITS